jgi:CubicO group peptidase (beta-lactamase class C family)
LAAREDFKEGVLVRMTRLAACATAFLLAPLSALAQDAPPPAENSILTWSFEQQKTGYRSMETVAAHQVVKRGESIFPLPAGTPIDPAFEIGGVRHTVESFMEAYRASGVLAIKDGKVILERYGLGRGPDDRWTSFSVAKSVTATLAGAAVKDGFIQSLDDPVSRYIPEMKGSAYDEVTVRQLLTMTSGVEWNEDYTDLNSDVAKVGLSVLEAGVNPVVSYMRRLPRAVPPGTKFNYSTGETDLAGIVVSKAVGKPLAQYLSEKIWAPFGMEQDAIWIEDVAGHERGGCCMSMTLRDYGRLGLFMLGGGVAGGRQVLPDGWAQEATRSHIAVSPDNPAAGGYGYFWWIGTDGSYQARGIFGQSITVVPEENLVIVVNSAWPRATGRDLHEAREAFVGAVRAAAK